MACEILTDFPERLLPLACVELWDEKTGPRTVAVRSCWISRSRGGQAIFHFAGSASIADAEKLVGLEVQIPLADRVALPRGSYYISDLTGCEVRTADGTVVGVVSDVQFSGKDACGTPLLMLDSAQGELLIPLADEICIRIDPAAKRILIAPPEGLLDLNQDS